MGIKLWWILNENESGIVNLGSQYAYQLELIILETFILTVFFKFVLDTPIVAVLQIFKIEIALNISSEAPDIVRRNRQVVHSISSNRTLLLVCSMEAYVLYTTFDTERTVLGSFYLVVWRSVRDDRTLSVV